MGKERKLYKLGDRASFKILPILGEYLQEINEIPPGDFSSFVNVAVYNQLQMKNLDERIRKIVKDEIQKIKEGD